MITVHTTRSVLQKQAYIATPRVKQRTSGGQLVVVSWCGRWSLHVCSAPTGWHWGRQDGLPQAPGDDAL